MMLFAIVGIVFSLLLFFGAEYISNNVLSNSGVKYTLMVLSPAIIFVAMTAVIRGYFVGMQNMAEYSKAQILEQVVNSVFSIIFVVILIGRTPEIMAAGSTLATTLYTIISFVYLIRYYNKYLKQKPNIKELFFKTIMAAGIIVIFNWLSLFNISGNVIINVAHKYIYIFLF